MVSLNVQLQLVSLVALLGVTSAAPMDIVKRASSKMGISWPVQEGTAAPVAKFFGSGSKVSWWYDWNKNYGPVFGQSPKPDISAEFVPMIFSWENWQNNQKLEQGYKAVQGFNEPDKTSGVSAALTATDAAAKWKTIVTELRKTNPDVELWSPAMAGDNFDWMSTFIDTICPSGLSGCDLAPTYMNVHVWATKPKNLKDHLGKWHDKWGVDLVVTEFACHEFGGAAPSPADVSAFMKDVTSWMDGTEWIHRYAWFGAMTDSDNLFGVAPVNQLMDADGNLNELGKQYIAGGQ